MSRSPSRKLLVASLGVASATYVAAASSLTSCGGRTDAQGDAGKAGDALTADDYAVGNLALPSCVPDDSVVCTGIATGFACSPGNDPGSLDPTFACSGPTPSGGGESDSYCCFQPVMGGSETTCRSDDTLTICPDAAAYPFVCVEGEDPATLDPSLACSPPTPDPDGVHTDSCCTLK